MNFLKKLFTKPAPTGPPAVDLPPPSAPASSLTPGDILIRQHDDLQWQTIKILAVDPFDESSSVAHCLLFQKSPSRPTLSAVPSLPPFILHAPIAAESFATGCEHLGNLPVEPADLEGFHTYLKLTDFPRYLSATGQSVQDLVTKAKEHYLRAHNLCEEGKHHEAIVEYDAAIDTFPYFFEAIDNRAFTLMDLGDYEGALAGFEFSLSIEPKGAAAFFSKGECLLKLGRLEEAAAVFEAGLPQFPEKRELFQTFLQKTLNLRSSP